MVANFGVNFAQYVIMPKTNLSSFKFWEECKAAKVSILISSEEIPLADDLWAI